MLKAIGAENGVATFQMMACNEGIYIFEMGYRINGNNDFTIIEKEIMEVMWFFPNIPSLR